MNKEEKRLYDIEYRKNNKEKINKNKKKYYLKNRKRLLNKYKKQKKEHPERYILHDIKNRCNNTKSIDYKNYGNRGIQCRITEEEIRFLMIRDGYWDMGKPSIDRIDNDGNYTLENCRFIEQSENCAKDKRKPVLQFDLDGNFIKCFNSISDASRELKISTSAIIQNLNGKTRKSGGFIWRYK